jgi:putative membrane protein
MFPTPSRRSTALNMASFGGSIHEEAIALFSNEARFGQDDALKNWAAKTLPTLREHLNMARRLALAQDNPKR